MRASSFAFLDLLACLVLLVPCLAQAQASPAPLPAATGAAGAATIRESPPAVLDPATLDTVRLKDGSLYRGTLIEHKPGGSTLLLLHDGTKQSFDAKAIAEVVPAAAASSLGASIAAPATAPPPPSALPHGWVRVRVHTTPDLRLFARKGGEGGYSGVCANDCETQLKSGPYDFQLRRSTGPIYQDAGMHDVDQDSRIDALLTSRRPARIAGGVILGGGVLTGAILLGRGLAKRADAHEVCDEAGELAPPHCGSDADSVGRGRIIGGVLTALASAVIGAVLVSRRDQLSVSVERAELGGSGSGSHVPFEPPVGAPNLRASSSGPVYEEAAARVREQQSAVRACIQELPATAEFHVAATGAISALHIHGDLEDAQRDCLWQALQKLSFPAGSERAASVDIQPALR
jgi:hypothetical protein